MFRVGSRSGQSDPTPIEISWYWVEPEFGLEDLGEGLVRIGLIPSRSKHQSDHSKFKVYPACIGLWSDFPTFQNEGASEAS